MTVGREGGHAHRRASSGRWLRRQRLHGLLADASEARLALLVAPAGSGKSVLLREFVDDRARHGLDVTWIDAGAAMADPAELRARLQPATSASTSARAPEPAVLVVDDLHRIDGTPGETALFEAIDRLPVTTNVLVATRKAPTYDLSAWRVADDLVEIGFDDLRFLTREVQALFDELYGAPLSDEEVAVVVEQTEGWAAALRLLESATRGRHPADRRGVLATPASRWPALGDYVRANVLAGVDEEARRVLVDAAVLGRLTQARVDELLARAGSGPVLAELQRRRLLVDDFRSDGSRVPRWLAVHLDDERATRLGAAAARAWSARAGELLLRDGEVAEAARCFSDAARNDELLALLDGPAGDRLAARPSDWLRSRPIMLERHPTVALARARRRLATGDLVGALAFYRRAETAATPEPAAGPLAELERERAAVEVWLEPEPPPADAIDDAVSWSAVLRRATHAEPRRMAQMLLGRPHATPAERLAGALALLLAGDVDESRRLTGKLSHEAEGHPAVPLVARLVHILLDNFAFPQPGPAVIHGTGAELEPVIADAERLHLPGLATVTSIVLELLAESPAGIARLVAARQRAGDRWAAMVVGLIGGILSARLGRPDDGAEADGDGPGPLDLLDEAIASARQLSAGVVEAWARTAAAMIAAHQGSPEAPAAASAAQHAGRDVGVPGAEAVAQAALAVAPGLRQEEHRAAAEALAAATCASGVPLVARLVGARRDRDRIAEVRAFGRDAELAALVARFEAVQDQGSTIVRITGEAGIGKTTLLAAFADHVRRRHGHVRSVTAVGGDGGGLTDAMLDALGEGLDAERLRVVLGFDIGATEARRDLDDERRAELLGRLLDWAARRRPLVVVVDGAERADAASLRLVVDVVGSMRVLPLLLVLAYREDELDAEAMDVLDQSLPSGPVLRLEPLGADDMRALIASELGVEPPPALVAAVRRLTGGTPGFVRETVARLGPMAVGDETFSGLVVPAGLHDLLQRRMARLGSDEADLVRVAAVLGEPIDESVVAAATGMGAADVAASLAAAAGLRITARDSDGRWRFTSSIFGRALAAEVPERHRVRAHRRAADHLEARVDTGDGSRVDALAEHLLAAHETNATRTVRWVTQAAAEAERHGDLDRAVGLCQRALDQVGADPSARGRLLLRVASARRRRGGDAESAGPYLAAVNAARAANDPELLARAVVGYARAVREFWRTDDQLVPLLAEALDRLPPHDSGPRVHVEARLSEVTRSQWGSTTSTPSTSSTTSTTSAVADRLADLSTEACDRAYRLADPGAVASALAAWYWTLTGLEDAGARLDAAAELARHAAEAADWELVLDARRFRHHDLLGQGDIAGADIELATFARLAREHGIAGSPWRLGVARAGRALLDGRFDDAEALSSDAVEAAAPLTMSGLPLEVRVAQQLLRAREIGELDAIEPVLRELVEGRPERPMWKAAQAWLLAETGHLAGARAELDRLVRDDLAAIESGPYWLPAVWFLGEVAVKVGRRNEAERLYRALLPWSGAIVVVPMSVAVLGSVAKVLGQLAAALGDLDDAVVHFEAAIDQEIRLGAGPLLAWSRLAYARTLLLASDQPVLGDDLLVDAIETGRGYGMQGLVAAAEELGRRVAASTGAGRDRSGSRDPDRERASEPAVPTMAGAAAASARGVVRPPRPTSRLRCLGGFELELRGRTVDVRGLKPRVRAVLWVLVSHAGRPVHAEQLIEALWPGVPSEAGRRNLQVAMSSLRQSLEPGVKRGPWQTVARDGDTYRLVLGDDVDADIRVFELAVAAARTLRSEGRRADAADRFEQALRTYGGDLIPEAGPADWVIGRRDGLRLAAAEAAQAAAELRLEASEIAAAIGACERGLQIDRYRDGLWRLLVRCCEADGNPMAAARAQREYEGVLAELGLSPQ